MSITRRAWIAAPALRLSAKTERAIAGGFVMESQAAGHRLRDRGQFARAGRTERCEIAVVGGGVAGLSAGWWLRKKGHQRFVILDGEAQAGGNARFGENEITAYPWAAHYVPVPNKESKLVRELFGELGLVDAAGQWDERWLCHSPQERLFIHGRWHEGIDADRHGTAEDRRQFQRFHERIAELRATGRYTIPRALGYRAGELDRITMQEWLRREKLNSPALAWEVDYSCRDDYGGGAADVTASAGLHYYAARHPETGEKGPLAWPEGNGWILRRLLTQLAAQVRTQALVHRVERAGTAWRVRTEQVDYLADAVVFAAPTFLTPYVVEGVRGPVAWQYSPWLTANLTIENAEALGEQAWDNVVYHSPSLGYVVATHQSLRRHQPRSVWTFYWALTGDPVAQRRWLLAASWAQLREMILTELAKAHPRIREHVSRLDIFRMGHAMRRPTPHSAPGPAMPEGIYLANSDLAGLSVFEEAQYQGVRGAEGALIRVGQRK